MYELMLITNDVAEAKIWDAAGVDLLFVDLEINGKIERQGHLNTVISKHTISDVSNLREAIERSKLLVRINPFDVRTTADEVDEAIERGADVIMLPMFTCADQVQAVQDMIKGRCELYPLIETPEALSDIERLAQIKDVSGYHFGLNDMHLALNLKFMFQVMLLPEFEYATQLLKQKQVMFGIGGIARVGTGTLPAEVIIREHYRLGATRAILSRSFKDECSSANAAQEIALIRKTFAKSKTINLKENLECFKNSIESIIKNAAK